MPDMVYSTFIPISNYSQNSEILALLNDDGWLAKWGGPLWAQTTLTYILSNL